MSASETKAVDAEKTGAEPGVRTVESTSPGKLELPDYARALVEFDYTPEEERRILRKVDRRVVITLGCLYCVSLIDRVNLGAANIAGMGRELELVGNRYSIVTLVFFIAYTLFQQPSIVIVRKIGPRKFLSLIVLLWGAVTIGMGFVADWEQLAGLRVVLGLFEAGLFPGSVYLLSTWYTRYEVGKRYSIFYLVGSGASAFAGILAYGLQQMDGLANLRGWRWIFIIDGILTCLLAFVSYLLLVDFPDSETYLWSFLNQRAKDWIVARVNADRGDARPETFNLRKYLSPAKDWKVWAYAVIFCNVTTINYALSFFLPVILTKNMGFSVGAAQCLVAPPYVAAGALIYGSAYFSDKHRLRAPFLVMNMIIAVIGLPIMGFHRNAGVRYFGVFLVTSGALASIPIVLSYQANNIRGQWKRAFCSGASIGFAGIGGIVGGLIFRAQDAPYYRPGLYICIGLLGLNILLVGCLTAAYRTLNRQADRGERILENEDGEFPLDFRYTY